MPKHAIAYTYWGEEHLIGPFLGEWDQYKLSTLRQQSGVSNVRVVDLECWYETKQMFRIPNTKTASRKETYEKRRRIHGGSTMVDATGSVRRLQALMAVGWSFSRLERDYGVPTQCFKDVVARNSKVGVDLAALIRRVYDERWDQTPPAKTPHERQSASRAKSWAKRHDWLPPAAWDDDTIDDPEAVPIDAEPASLTYDQRVRLAVQMVEYGATQKQAAKRFKVADKTIREMMKGEAA